MGHSDKVERNPRIGKNPEIQQGGARRLLRGRRRDFRRRAARRSPAAMIVVFEYSRCGVVGLSSIDRLEGAESPV